MELYIKQRVFSWGDKFSIYNKELKNKELFKSGIVKILLIL